MSARRRNEREPGLTAKHIIVLELHRRNTPLPEIARRMGITLRAVYSLKARAIDAMQRMELGLADTDVDLPAWIDQRLTDFGRN